MASFRLESLLNRRAVLHGAAVLAVGTPSSNANAAVPNRQPLNLDVPLDNLYAFAKMFGTFGPKPVYPSYRGVCFARIGDEAVRPLFGYEGFTTLRMDLLPNGHVKWWGKELAFYTDLETGLPLDRWNNPYTGESCEVMHFLNDRQFIELTEEMPEIKFPDQAKAAGKPSGKIKATANGKQPWLLPWLIQEDLVMMTLEHTLRYPNPLKPEIWKKASTGPYINPAEHYLYFGSRAEIENRDLPSAKFTGGFMRTAPWFPWMLMGSIAGTLVVRAHMWKSTNGPENIPAKLLKYVQKRHPEFLEVPTVWDNAPNPSSWEIYARTHQPT